MCSAALKEKSINLCPLGPFTTKSSTLAFPFAFKVLASIHLGQFCLYSNNFLKSFREVNSYFWLLCSVIANSKLFLFRGRKKGLSCPSSLVISDQPPAERTRCLAHSNIIKLLSPPNVLYKYTSFFMPTIKLDSKYPWPPQSSRVLINASCEDLVATTLPNFDRT